jgi:nicotinate-nucleotide adenylyltransferase
MPESKPPRKMGVFGGAFDPPHHTHATLIASAIAQLQLDELRVIPTGHAWHKARPLSAAADRLAMARLAFSTIQRVVVDARETQRAGPSYTVDTLRELRQENPDVELVLLMGGDQARALPTWHRFSEILQTATICVAERADMTWVEAVSAPLNRSNAVTSGANIRPDDLPGVRFLRLQMPLSSVSATDIRARVTARQSIESLVCPAVARYIVQYHLYQTA